MRLQPWSRVQIAAKARRLLPPSCRAIAPSQHWPLDAARSRYAGRWTCTLDPARFPKPNTAPADEARIAFIEEFHAGRLDRGNEFHERIHGAADDPFARFHALNRRQRQLCGVRKRTLIHPKQGARGPQLRSGDQCRLQWIDVLNMDYNAA